MTDSHSRAPALEQEDEAIPDTEAREAAEHGDLASGGDPFDAEPKKIYPPSKMALEGLRERLRKAEEDAAAKGVPLHPRNPAKTELEIRVKYVEDQQDYVRKQFAAISNAQRLLVIDIEATCYDPTPPGADMDVIEVGGVLLDGQTLESIEEIQMYIKPTHTEVGEFCTELTGITPEMVANAPSFVARMQELQRFVQDRGVDVWVSFGAYDCNKLASQSLRDGVANPLADIPHINLKRLVGLEFGYGKFAPGLNGAINLLKVERQGRMHSGIDDAKNTASVLRAIVQRRQLSQEADASLDDQPRNRKPRM